MIDDTGSEQPKPTQEDQPKERVIEVNEWFTPYEDYDKILYDHASNRNADIIRTKTLRFKLANVGNFRTQLWWDAKVLVDPEEARGERYLLVLPNSEKIIDGSELKKEQEKMETRPVKIELQFEDEELYGKDLPYNLETELPSGQIISAGMDNNEVTDGPGAFDNWQINGERFHGPVIPEVSNLINKLQFRFVPKE